MKREAVELFEKLDSQFEALYKEAGDVAKKKPDAPINKFKLGIINGLLIAATKVLGAKYEPLPGFSRFDDEDLPTASDVVMVCAQYISCLEKFRADHIHQSAGHWVWRIEGEQVPSIRTRAPKKIFTE